MRKDRASVSPRASHARPVGCYFVSAEVEEQNAARRFVRASLAVVTMLMAKKTARRARSYLRAYRNPDAVSYSLIEKFVKLHKTHRNILDQETAYLEKMVKLCSEIKKEAGFFKEAAERDERERDAEARDEARLLEALCAELHM